MTSIYVDSRLRAQGTDSSFSFDIGESVHIQSGAKLAVYKVRIADAFLSTDRGTFLYWEDEVAGTLHYAELPVGAYTGPRLAAWISSNFAAATYTAETNELDVTYDGVRLILNDVELRRAAFCVRSNECVLRAVLALPLAGQWGDHGRSAGPRHFAQDRGDLGGPLGAAARAHHTAPPALQAHGLRGQRGEHEGHQRVLPDLLGYRTMKNMF